MRIRRHNRRKGMPGPVKFLLVIVFVAGISLGLAFFWQRMQEESAVRTVSEDEQSDTSEKEIETSGDSSTEELSEASDKDSTEESETEQSEVSPEAGPEDTQRREAYPYALRATGNTVDKSYFDDAIFFGDSISTGIPLYGAMPNAKVEAFTGINTQSILTSKVVDLGEEERVTLLEAAKRHGDKKKVYIMLGGNGLDFDVDTFIDGYRKFVNMVREQYPNAIIYLQSITPVTDDAYLVYPSVSNEKINQYNVAIMNMAHEEKVYYLDVAAALVNEEGKLPEEGHAGDGMHLQPEYYYKWFYYLRTHAVEE